MLAPRSKFKKVKLFYIFKRTSDKISSILKCRKIPERVRMRLQNHFFSNRLQLKTHLVQPKTSQKNLEKISIFQSLRQVAYYREPYLLYALKIFGLY